jgi:flagellar basal-body rod modification protein FlgD
MPTDPISSSTYVAPPNAAAKPKSQLDMETFMRLLTTQLANQNPLEPMNDRDFFAQMAQLGTVQGMDDLKKAMDVGQAAALMGKTVTAVRPMTDSGGSSNDLVQGVVARLQVVNGEYYLGLRQPDGGIVDVKMGNIQKVEG